MKIRVIGGFVAPGFAPFIGGEIIDAPEALAHAWIEAKRAIPFAVVNETAILPSTPVARREKAIQHNKREQR